jgi:hypothetical protein
MKTGYSGGRSPGDVSHSSIRAANSACRALRMISSRAAPGGSNLASARRRFCLFEKAGLKGLGLFETATQHDTSPALRVLTVGFCRSDLICRRPAVSSLVNTHKFAAAVHLCTFANATERCRTLLLAARLLKVGWRW